MAEGEEDTAVEVDVEGAVVAAAADIPAPIRLLWEAVDAGRQLLCEVRPNEPCGRSMVRLLLLKTVCKEDFV